MQLRNIFIALTALAVAATPTFATFSDVPASHPQQEAITFVQEKGVGKDGKFYPSRPVNLAEFLTMGFLAAGISPQPIPETELVPFSDIDRGSWYAPYVARADQLGLLADYRGKLIPHRTLTRGEAAKIALGIYGVGVPAGVMDETFGLADVPASHRYAPFIYQALKVGAMDPATASSFGINQRLTRADAAQLFYQLSSAPTEEDGAVVIIGQPQSNVPNVGLLELVWDEVQKKFLYADQIDQQKMLDGAVQGAVDALGDPYSTYMPAQESDNFNGSLAGEVEGIGAHLMQDEQTDDIVIVSPIKGSPADRAGLLPEDIITAVDGVSVRGLSLEEVVAKIKGEAGTSVTLTIQRGSQALTVPITRARVEVKSVSTEYRNNIAILSVTQFGSATTREFAAAAADIKAKAPRGIVLDLRRNPGGLLDAAVDMVGYFVPKGSVAAKARYRADVRASDTIYTTKREPTLAGIPLVVLVDKGSASASEIVAGALQDHDAGTLIGETTFGKGTMQELSFFSNGASLKLTVAHWLSPNEQPIDKHGVDPDVVIADNPDTLTDEQLEAGLRQL